MVTWVLLLFAVTAVAAELVLLERDRQSLLTRRTTGPTAERRPSFLRRVLPTRPAIPRRALHADSAARDPRALTETAAPDFKQEAAADGPASLRSTALTLLQRLFQASPPRHAAQDVVYWINLESEALSPPLASVAAGTPSEPDPGPPHAAAPSATQVAARVESRPIPNDTRSARTAAVGPVATHAPATTSVEDGIVYVDAAGRCTFANQTARELLHWTSGDLSLSDVLVGGSSESTTLLQTIAREESIQQRMIWQAGAAAVPLEVSALALRDRDGNLWGAALFIRRPATA